MRRVEQLALLREQGIEIGSSAEQVEQAPQKLQARPAVIVLEGAMNDRGDYDQEGLETDHYILLTVKQTDMTPQLAALVARLAGSNGVVVCLQNGVGHVELLRSSIPAERLLVAVTTEAALRLSDREALHTGRGETWIGAAVPGIETAVGARLQKKLAEQLELAGFRSMVSNEITTRVWRKWLVNVCINPLTAILQVRNGELLQLPHARELMHRLLAEALTVAKASGVKLPADMPQQVEDVCRRTAANRSSMLQDVLAGRRTEIEAITGSLVRLGEQHGLAMTVNRSLYELVRALEERDAPID